MSGEVRILALFGARVMFGQELANIGALVALQNQGCEVLCVIRSETWPELLDLRRRLDAHGLAWTTAPYPDYPVRGWLLWTTLRNPFAYIFGNIALVRAARRFRATHLHAFNPFYVASMFSAIRALNLPLVYRCGDRPVRHNGFYRWVWRRIVGRAAHFVADSRFIRGALTESGVAADRITVLYAPPPRRTVHQAACLPAAAASEDRVRFVYVGRITAEKGVHHAVEAMSLIAARDPRPHLVIAGGISDWSGDDWGRALRARVAADPLLAGRVHFLGFVEDAPSLMSVCHAHLAPSMTDEAYGLVVVEAKSVALSSIIYPSGGMSELIEHGVDGLIVEDKSPEGLAAAMTAYLEDPGAGERLGRSAKDSLSKLQLQDFEANWRLIYERATSGS